MDILLIELNLIDSGIHCSAIISNDGLVFAHAGQTTIDEDYMASICASIFTTNKQGLARLNGGNTQQIAIKGDARNLLAQRLDDNLMLVVLTTPETNDIAIFQHMANLQAKLDYLKPIGQQTNALLGAQSCLY
jgi:predicted regulator of Ras-like GTPase activity (Roadblock/LC7/MglB family)